MSTTEPSGNSGVQEPRSGQLFIYPRRDVATSQLHISNHEVNGCYVMLSDYVTGEPKASFYVRGGDSAYVDIPLGKYEIYFATGDKWYGKDRLFAGNTEYFKLEEPYESEVENGDPVGKWIPLNSGLVMMHRIFAGEFPW